MNYVYAAQAGCRLAKWKWQTDKPWTVYGLGQISKFPTHAEAIAYADKLTKEQP